VGNASLRWLNNVSCLFCHSCYLQVEYNCSLLKVDCMLDACTALRVVGAVQYWLFFSGVGIKMHNPRPANGKQGLISE